MELRPSIPRHSSHGYKFKPGGINGQSARLTAPPSIGVEVSLFRAIPVSFAAGTLGSRIVIALPVELQQLSPLAGLEPATGDPM